MALQRDMMLATGMPPSSMFDSQLRICTKGRRQQQGTTHRERQEREEVQQVDVTEQGPTEKNKRDKNRVIQRNSDMSVPDSISGMLQQQRPSQCTHMNDEGTEQISGQTLGKTQQTGQPAAVDILKHPTTLLGCELRTSPFSAPHLWTSKKSEHIDDGSLQLR